MATKSKVVSTEMLRARSARKTAAPFSTPTSRMASPAKSRLICAPISATRAAISSRRNNISCSCSLIGAFFHESLCENTRLYCKERRTHVSLIHVGHLSIGTFGLCLWLASVCACWVLYRNFRRHGVDADAVGVAAYTTVGGVLGAKLWHVLEDPTTLMHQPLQVLFDRAGF